MKQKEYMESLKSTANFTPTVWAASLVIRARVLMRVVHRRWVWGSKTWLCSSSPALFSNPKVQLEKPFYLVNAGLSHVDASY